MPMTTAIQKARDRLEFLLNTDGAAIVETRKNGLYGTTIDDDKYIKWRMSALTIIKSLVPGTHYEREFQAPLGNEGLSPVLLIDAQLSVLRALLEDLDGGHLANVRGLVRAEVFGDFIEQAQHLHEEGFWQPAAVVAGAVLEDHLRKLCDKYTSIILSNKPKLDAMNAELMKAGEYNVLVNKRITYLADIRNKAAHGHWDKFTEADSRDLIQSVLRFLTEHPL